ncbi:MAG: c-type cytochrome, partial [Acidobacteria bacterium]|nr:c-type cytochrome [Acidobacteriota bacterium]
MRVLGLLVIGTVVAWGGDARRGGDLFKTEGCIQCHRVGGEGGTAGPDLGRRTSRGYTPAVMAAVMWNHAPAMWQAISGRGNTRPTLTPEQADDMFAFFYWARYFDDPGDAARGKQLFSSKHCSHCHGITASRRAGAPAVVKWGSL